MEQPTVASRGIAASLWEDGFVSTLSADDRAAIERAADAYVAAMNSADWRRVARSFSDAAVRIPPTRSPTKAARRSRDG